MVSLRERLSVPPNINPQQFADEACRGERDIWFQAGMSIQITTQKQVEQVLGQHGVGTLGASAYGAPEVQGQLDGKTPDQCEGLYNEANLAMLDVAARELSRLRRPWAANVLAAVKDFEACVRKLCDHGVHFLHVGAGLPRDLSRIMADFPETKYVPIVSSAGAAKIMMQAAVGRDEMKKRAALTLDQLAERIADKRGKVIDGRREYDALYVELPQHAGGHLGAKDVDDANDVGKFDAWKLLEEIERVAPGVPKWLGGGITGKDGIERALKERTMVYEEVDGQMTERSVRYSGVGIATPFLVSTDSGVPDELLKKYHLDPRYPVVKKMWSPANLPGSYIDNGFMNHATIPAIADKARQKCVNCIGRGRCAFFQKKKPSYCFMESLATTPQGDPNSVLFAGGPSLEQVRADLDGGPIPTTAQVVQRLFNGQKLVDA